MAGKLTMQPVAGDAPALRVGTLSAVSTVQLTRAVSKLRFVFAKTTGQPTVSITSIKINENMIPDVEYLFDKPESAPTITYNTEAGELLSSPIDDIKQTADPTDYIYFNQDAQEYENLINTAASKETPEVTVRGPIYLRESDKQLAGTITYTIAGGEPQSVGFQMQQAGDFLRNHTWIVYAYYAGSGKLQVQTVYVKDWSTKEIGSYLHIAHGDDHAAKRLFLGRIRSTDGYYGRRTRRQAGAADDLRSLFYGERSTSSCSLRLHCLHPRQDDGYGHLYDKGW